MKKMTNTRELTPEEKREYNRLTKHSRQINLFEINSGQKLNTQQDKTEKTNKA